MLDTTRRPTASSWSASATAGTDVTGGSRGRLARGAPVGKAAWSAASSIALSRLPGAGDGKLGLQLLTNVAPAGGNDAVTWQAPGLLSNHPPPDGQFQGSPSLLKSALQKNVRLCRPASAIRRGP